MKQILKDKFWLITAIFILLKLGLHLLTYDNYELHRDEMLFFNQGEHPGFGNATVPPFIGWIAFLVKSIFGHSVFGIRLIPAIAGALSVFMIARIVKELGGQWMALVLSCTAFLLSPGFLLFDSLFTVNVFDQLFWLLIAYLFIRMINTGNPKIWIWIGIASGIAFLNKYLVLFLLTGFLVALLLSTHRKVLLNRYFVYALITGILIISPNVYWQYAHDWPIFYHFSELQKTQMVNMSYRNFLIDLFNLNYVSTFLWLAGCFAVLFIKSEKKYRYLGLLAVIVIVLFLISRGKAYYTLGLYPVLFALSGYILEKYLKKKLKTVNYLVLALIILFSGLAVPLSLPLLPFEKLEQYSERTNGFVSYPFSRWEDGKTHQISQVFSDMTGWKEMVILVDEAYRQIGETERKNTTIYAERNYGYAGAVHFYGRQYNLPDAITFLDSYVLWAPDTIPRGPVIYINHDIAGLCTFFEKITEIGIVRNKYFREDGLKVFLCERPNDKMTEAYKQKAGEEKDRYR